MLPKKKVYWKSRKSQPKIAFATLCCIYAVCVQLMLHTWIRIDWCIFEHVKIFIRNIPFAPYSRADPCNDVNKHLRPISLTPILSKIFQNQNYEFFFLSTGKKVNIKSIIALLTERNLSAARYIKRVTLESGSCRSKCRFISRTRTLGYPDDEISRCSRWHPTWRRRGF